MTGKVEAETAIRAEDADRVGVIALIAGTAIIAWSGILVRFLDVGPLAGAAWRMSLAVPALAVWAKVAQRRGAAAPGLRQAAVPLILAGLAFAVDVGSFHLAINGTKVANATFIGNVAPILAVIGGAIFFAEHPPWRVWLALALALLGAWVMAGMVPPSRVGAGDALALVSAAAYASYLLIVKLLRAKSRRPDRHALVGGRFGCRADDRGAPARRDHDPLDPRRLDDRLSCSASSLMRWGRD